MSRQLRQSLIDNHSQLAEIEKMVIDLVAAPSQQNLLVHELSASLPNGMALVLEQMGLLPGETITKVHAAPLGDPITIQIGEQLFALRKEIVRKILVKTDAG